MIASYPAAGARYARHVDNPNANGRKLTAILYLNPGWEVERGGNLNIFTNKGGGVMAPAPVDPEGKATSIYDVAWPHEAPAVVHEEEVTTIVPAMDRMVVFWSDERCPHEVTAVNEGFGPRLAVTTWYFDNAELAEMNAKESALVGTVRAWCDRCLVWDESLRDGERGDGQEQSEVQCVDNVAEQAWDVSLAKVRTIEHQRGGWMCAVTMQTVRARFRNDMDTPVPPSAHWWRAGLLASFRGAVNDPVASWDRAVVSSRTGVNERLAARLDCSAGSGAESGSENVVAPEEVAVE